MGARSSLAIVAVLCFLLVVAAPIGAWLLVRIVRGRVQLSRSGLVARGLAGTTSFQFNDVARLGFLEVPIVARGIGGALVKRRVGGDKAVYLVALTHSGKTRKFIVSSYENYQEIMGEVSARAQKPYEALKTGLFDLKWPEEALPERRA